jgi:hypothetical protein
MPQLDITFFSNVLVYLSIIFFLLVFVLKNYFLPYISLMIKLRNKVLIRTGEERLVEVKRYRKGNNLRTNINLYMLTVIKYCK